MHPVVGAESIEAGDRRRDRQGAGADDQRVVLDRLLATGARDVDLVPVRVDRAGDGVEPQRRPGRLQVRDGAVGEVAPVGDVA